MYYEKHLGNVAFGIQTYALAWQAWRGVIEKSMSLETVLKSGSDVVGLLLTRSDSSKRRLFLQGKPHAEGYGGSLWLTHGVNNP